MAIPALPHASTVFPQLHDASIASQAQRRQIANIAILLSIDVSGIPRSRSKLVTTPLKLRRATLL